MAETPKYRELTPASLVGGILVGLLLNMGICFAGLQIGFTIVGSTVSAVLGFGLLRGVLRKGSILEVNIFQTVASSVNTVNAGVIFTIPVLFLMGRQEEINYWALALAVTAGSVLGVVMIIPLRKQVIELERLRFPSAVAVAAILKSPGAGVEKARLLILGIVVSSIVSFLTIRTGIGSSCATWATTSGAPENPLGRNHGRRTERVPFLSVRRRAHGQHVPTAPRCRRSTRSAARSRRLARRVAP